MKEINKDEIDITTRLPGLMYLDGTFTNNVQNAFQDKVGVDSSVLTSVAFGRAVFTANFFISLNSYEEQTLAKHEIKNLFGQRSLIRIRTSESPYRCYYVRPGVFTLSSIAPGNNDMQFSIPFDVPSGFAYSLKRSDEITEDEMDFGMNDVVDLGSFKSTANTFTINNLSSIAIDPYFQKHDLNIAINSDGPITITNKTNNTSWSYKSDIAFSDSLLIRGIVTYRNGVVDTMNTDFGFIKLEKGLNEILVTGSNNHSITFSFPFIYL
ncbi:hypothetical protein WOSG25_270080 [Weissella oryzae SG25]|uniref:Siphovirus-type tail component RIFT-related domain-containing protein n=1 Tax=Weissella oryzae (strain DSM 25784 / JCM 18191 / LMG 30913 / SG25) TaxID=1329250 RepID=A0A069CXG9_WEIOS|nr:phage tail domain-containing protein [Weissella oryzae]GAK32062.1 hypothetical protein WOSG25_270080 [Weissella oryzae SG25]